MPCAAHQVGSGKLAGEAIAACDSCYIKASDNLAWRSNGTSANEAARCDGFAAKASAVGEAVTLYDGVEFHYGAALTPGAPYYVAATAGRLDTAPTTGGIIPVAFAIDATRIRVRADRPQSDAVATQGAAVADLGALTATAISAAVPALTATAIAAAVPSAAPAGGTGATEGAYDTAGNRDAAIVTINDLRTHAIEMDLDYEAMLVDVAAIRAKLNALLDSLQAAGVIAA